MPRTRVPSTTRLPDGRRVRLRLPHVSDRGQLAALLERLGMPSERLDATRLLRFDPRRRAVVCATVWDGDVDVIAGLGSIDLRAGARPDAVIADEALAPGVTGLLRDALVARADDHARRAA